MAETKKRKSSLKEELDTKLASIAVDKERIDSGLVQFEQAVQDTRGELVDLRNNVESDSRIFNNAFILLDLVAWLIPLITFIALYLALPLNVLALDTLTFVMPLWVVLRIIVFVVRIQLREENTSLTSSIKRSLLGFLGSRFRIPVRGSKFDKAFSFARTIAGRTITAVGSYLPGVKDYYEGKQILQNQLFFRTTLRNSLIEYGFELGDKVESYLDNFSSFSPNKDDWLDDATRNLSISYGEPQVPFPQAIFKLAYTDYNSDDSARKNEWRSISNDLTMFQQFTIHLVKRNLFNIPLAYREPAEPAVEFFAKMLAPSKDFTLSDAQKQVSDSFATLEREKGDLLRTLWANHIPIPEGDRPEFLKLLPKGDSLTELLVWLERHTKVQSYVLQLFFYDFRAEDLQRDEHFSNLKKNREKIGELSRELLSRKIIPAMEGDDRRREDDISNLTTYLSEVPDYDRAKIASTFASYSRLFEYSRKVLDFLKVQSICQNSAKLSFTRLLQATTPDVDFLTQLQIVTQLLIEEFSSFSSGAAEWLEPIALSALTVFLNDNEDMYFRSPMCQRAATKRRVVQILYEYSWTNFDEQDKLTTDKATLHMIIERVAHVIDGEKHSDVFFTEFSRFLTTGFLYRSIREIPDRRARYMEEQMNAIKDQLDFKTKLDKHLSALNTVLRSQLDTETIMESLRMQLVGAYQITIPTRANVLSAIVDDYLPDVCAELAKTDPVYEDLFTKAEARESLGFYTRIGVIPYRMDFKRFAELLRNAFAKAVSKYEQLGQLSHPIDQYLANMIRIFPTSGYFQQLAPENHEGKGANDLLADILGPLMIKKFGNIRSLEIIASLKTQDENNVAMRDMVAKLYDTNSRIYFIAHDELDGVLFNPALSDYVKVGPFDETLANRFNKQSLSELAITMYRSSMKSGSETVRQNFQNQISEICKAINARPDAKQVENVSAVIFQALYDVGMILNFLSPETRLPLPS